MKVDNNYFCFQLGFEVGYWMVKDYLWTVYHVMYQKNCILWLNPVGVKSLIKDQALVVRDLYIYTYV